MYTHRITMKLKANADAEFTRIIETEIVPLLSTQKGFRDRTTSIALARSEAVALSFWDTKEDAVTYDRTMYPKVLIALSKVLEGKPKVKIYEVFQFGVPITAAIAV